MAKIAFANDVLVPAIVAGVNIGVAEWDARRPAESMKFEPIAGIVGVAVGYGMQAFDFQPTIGNRVAVASWVPAARGIYGWIRTAVAGGASTRIAAHRPVGTTRVFSPGPSNPGNAQEMLRRYQQGGI